MKAYHYTNESSWNRIKRIDDCYEPFLSGLKPLGRFLSLDFNVPSEAYEPAVFALLEPEPREWKTNKKLWHLLMSNVSRNNNISLLEINLTEKDKAYVFDRAIANRTFWKEGASKEEVNKAANQYWNSRVPIKDYGMNYELPEVVVFNFIPINQIKLIKQERYTEILERLYN